MTTTAARADRAQRASAAPPTAAAPPGPRAAPSPEAPTRLAGAATAALVATTATTLLAMGALSFLPSAVSGHGERALLAWVLCTAALLGALLSAYLMIVWSLAALALALGPASRAGSALVITLRIVAPRLARRVTLSAAIASTATGLVLVPATATTLEEPPAPTVGTASATWGAAEPAAPLPTEATERTGGSSPSDPAADETEPSAGASGSGELPSLGWGQSPGHTEAPTTLPEPPVDSTASTDSTGSYDGAQPPEVASITVRPGDSLWSITDDLLGPDTDPPELIASTWPVLYEANRDLIGADPDSIVPGQELTVPSLSSSQEKS